MRDIREDLRERLDALAADRLRAQEQLTAIESLENNVKATLREEETRIARLSANRAALPFPESLPSESPLFVGPVIKGVMKSKNRPLGSDEIRDEILNAKSFDFSDKAPGRVIHFGLVSLKNGGEVEQLSDGRWIITGRSGIPVQEAQVAH